METENFFVKNIEKNLNILYFSENPSSRWEAQKFLNEFQNKSDSWKINFLIKNSTNKALLYFGINLLDRLVSFSWDSIGEHEKIEIENFVINWIIEFTSNKDLFIHNSTNINKINLVLVKIMCNREKKVFSLFIFDLLNSSKKNEITCENNLNLLYCLFDELFSNQNFEKTKLIFKNDYRFEESLTEVKKLCFFILEQNEVYNSGNFRLICVALKTTKKILEISPNSFNLERKNIENLILLCFSAEYGNFSLKCLIEWFKKKRDFIDKLNYEIMEDFVAQFLEIFPITLDYVKFFSDSNQECRNFLKNSSLLFFYFLLNIFGQNSFKSFDRDYFFTLMKITLKLSCLPDLEIYKNCLDIWEIVFSNKGSINFFENRGLKNFDFFCNLISVFMGRISKPEEVLIIEGENGELIRDSTGETDTKNFHSKSKYLLSFLTEINFIFTKEILSKKMKYQIEQIYLPKNSLNTLVWSIGAISGIFPIAIENEFLVLIIKDLLFLCEIRKGKENKALIASNIMYVVGQYPRFLKANYKFLKAVIFKLFEFMHEKCLGIKDMACDTFLKIGKNCADEIIQIDQDSEKSIIGILLSQIEQITESLEFRQISIFYKTLGLLFDHIENDQKRNSYISKIFQSFLTKWTSDLKPKILSGEINSIIEVKYLLKINIEIAKILKKKYYLQIKTLFREIFFLFRWSTQFLHKNFQIQGSSLFSSKISVEIKILRFEILEVCKLYLYNCILDQKSLFPLQNCRILCESIFLDYQDSFIYEMRESYVVDFCRDVLEGAKNSLDENFVILVFNSIIKPTQEMLIKNFEDFPELRKSFFSLLGILVQNFFTFILRLGENHLNSEESFEFLVHGIIWGIKHPDSSISILNLKTCMIMIKSIEKEEWGYYFYKKFFKQILNDIISVMTDKLHVPALKFQCNVLTLLLKNSKKFFEVNYLKNYLKQILQKVFYYYDQNYLENIVILLFVENNTKNIMKEFIRILKSGQNLDVDEESSGV